MSKKFKPILCMDFDGVIHSYTSGWAGAATIIDPPTPGALQFLAEMIKQDKYKIAIYSPRSNQPGGILAMKDWFRKWFMLQDLYMELVNDLDFPVVKPPAFVTVDDRCICFDGDFYHLFDKIQAFRPWNKKEI